MVTSTFDILAALRRRHDHPRNGDSRAWVYAEEVRVATGWLSMPDEEHVDTAIKLGREQSIDAFALHTWHSKKYRRVAYEVKSSRSDLARELDQPHKQDAALALSTLFYLVAPPDVYDGFAIPAAWGIMAYRPESGLRIERRAPWRDTPWPPYSFMLSFARKVQQEGERATRRAAHQAWLEASSG